MPPRGTGKSSSTLLGAALSDTPWSCRVLSPVQTSHWQFKHVVQRGQKPGHRLDTGSSLDKAPSHGVPHGGWGDPEGRIRLGAGEATEAAPPPSPRLQTPTVTQALEPPSHFSMATSPLLPTPLQTSDADVDQASAVCLVPRPLHRRAPHRTLSLPVSPAVAVWGPHPACLQHQERGRRANTQAPLIH